MSREVETFVCVFPVYTVRDVGGKLTFYAGRHYCRHRRPHHNHHNHLSQLL